ncbi:MAG: helix-turn-helix transcriptional regulator [Lachnospiraceae bacterium]|nr:helix-turn-helix transcriptional regulator [Lachnospiraceae bacterium]
MSFLLLAALFQASCTFQNEFAAEMDVTPGYISNVENGRTVMSLRLLIYYAKIMGITLDELVGNLEPDYAPTALDNALMAEISRMENSKKEKLLETIKIWR